MKKGFFLALVFSMVFSQTWAQSALDSYKYVIVPSKFSFLKQADQYQVNSLVKFLFEREGFNVVTTNDSFPADLGANSCLGLNLDVIDESGMFNTKLKFSLRDCKNNVVHDGKVGTSREKDFKTAYHQAIRSAFEEFESMNYSYNPAQGKTQEIAAVTLKEAKFVEKSQDMELDRTQKSEPEKVKAEIKEKKAKEETPKKIEKEVEEISKPKVAEKKEKKKAQKKESRTDKIKEPKEKIENNTAVLVGNYDMGQWGISSIVENGDIYKVIGGDEKIEIGTVYKTSRKNTFIIKWTAFKQPRLLVLNGIGNLQIDGIGGKETYKKVH